MDTEKIWLIDHKATLGEFSPMNLDGSSWILGVCILAAADKDNAALTFKEFLKNNEMELIDLYEFQQYISDNFEDDSRRSAQIKNAARMVLEDGKTCYVYAQTSEAMQM